MAQISEGPLPAEILKRQQEIKDHKDLVEIVQSIENGTTNPSRITDRGDTIRGAELTVVKKYAVVVGNQGTRRRIAKYPWRESSVHTAEQECITPTQVAPQPGTVWRAGSSNQRKLRMTKQIWLVPHVCNWPWVQ